MNILRNSACAMLASAFLCPVYAAEVCESVKDTKLIAQDDKNTFLGKIANRYDTDSIFNEYRTDGGPYSTDSIWNKYGRFGSEYSSYAPQNKYTSTPPLIVKGGKVIGYLTANKSTKPSITAELLKALCEDEL